MPHFTDFGGARLAAPPEKKSFHTPFGTTRSKESFGSFEPREVISVEVGKPPEPEIGGLQGEFQVDERFGPDWWYEVEDHSRGSSPDSLTGEGRPMNAWTNGSATSFEDRNWVWQDCNNVKSDQDNNDVVIGVRKNVSGTFAFETGLPVEGLHDSVHCITAGCGQNVPIGGRLPPDNLGANSAGGSFITETFEPLPGMHSFGESRNPVLEAEACNGYDCTNAGSCSNPAVLKAMFGSTSGLGGMSI